MTRVMQNLKKNWLVVWKMPRNRIFSSTNLKEEFTDLFWKLQGYGIPYSPTQAEQTEDGEEDLKNKSMLFTYFYLM